MQLIASDEFFTFTPLLHEVATGMLCESDVRFSMKSFIKSTHFNIVQAKATQIDFATKSIQLDSGAVLHYETLVIATGARSRRDIVSGSEHAYCLKTVIDAQKIRNKIIELIRAGKTHLEVNIIGGGFTGLELVCEIDQMLNKAGVSSKVRLFERDDIPLAKTDPKLSKYIAKRLRRSDIDFHAHANVEAVLPAAVVSHGQEYYSDMTVLAAGVIPNTELIDADYLDERKNIIVSPFLNLEKHPEVFALGDIISIAGEGKPAMLAQLATRQAGFVADNISNLISGKALRRYTSKVIGLLISLGTWDAVGRIFGMPISGRIAWYIWRTVYLFKTPGLANQLRIATRWTKYLFKSRSFLSK